MLNSLRPTTPALHKRGSVRLLGSVMALTLLSACPALTPSATVPGTLPASNGSTGTAAVATSTPHPSASADIIASGAAGSSASGSGFGGSGTGGAGASGSPAPSTSSTASPTSTTPAPAASQVSGGSGSYSPPNQPIPTPTPVPTPTPAFTVLSTPANAAVSVAHDQPFVLAFGTAMDMSTLTAANFTVTQPGAGPLFAPVAVPGSLVYDAPSKTLTFTPTSLLDINTTFTATLTTGAKTLGGLSLASNDVFTFTTGAQVTMTPQLMAYSILSGGMITDIGASHSTAGGDVGEVGAAAATALMTQPITFIVPGAYTSTVEATSAEADLSKTYNDAAGRTWGGLVLAPALGNTNVVPGVYRDNSLTTVATSTYTMDATNASDPANAVFIIQVTGSLTTGASTNILLAGGALAKNIYWQVGSDVTLGATSTMRGNILSHGFISFGDNVTLHGRALGQSGDVTISADTVTP